MVWTEGGSCPSGIPRAILALGSPGLVNDAGTFPLCPSSCSQSLDSIPARFSNIPYAAECVRNRAVGRYQPAVKVLKAPNGADSCIQSRVDIINLQQLVVELGRKDLIQWKAGVSDSGRE